MSASQMTMRAADDMTAALSDRLFEVVTRHGVRGDTVDLEVELWQALGGALRRGLGDCEREVASVADAAYQVALRHGLRGPFLDVRLDLWHDLQDAACGPRHSTMARV